MADTDILNITVKEVLAKLPLREAKWIKNHIRIIPTNETSRCLDAKDTGLKLPKRIQKIVLINHSNVLSHWVLLHELLHSLGVKSETEVNALCAKYGFPVPKDSEPKSICPKCGAELKVIKVDGNTFIDCPICGFSKFIPKEEKDALFESSIFRSASILDARDGDAVLSGIRDDFP